MNRKWIRLAASFLALPFVLAGCEGVDSPLAPGGQNAASSGGPGDDGPPSGGGDASGAVVYVVHGINGTDLGEDEALPVDVAVNGSCVLENVRFRDIAGPLEVPAGDYDLEVRFAADPACSGDVAVSAEDVPLADGDNVSVAAHLTPDDGAVLTPFANDVTAKPGRTRISARHAAAFGPVDVLVDDEVVRSGLANGEQVGAFLRPGRHDVALTPEGSQDRVFDLTSVFEPFVLYAAYAVGTPGNDTFEVLVQTIKVGPRAGDDDDDDDGDDDGKDDDEKGDDDGKDDDGKKDDDDADDDGEKDGGDDDEDDGEDDDEDDDEKDDDAMDDDGKDDEDDDEEDDD